MNAVDAMRGLSRPALHLSVTVEDGGICLRVRDSGSGIPPEHLNRIFDPFFTTKGVQQGTGLGLSVCFSIVQQHGGTIEVETTGRDGTVFALWLPITADVRDMAQDTAVRSEESAASETLSGEFMVLIVDDEEFITSLVHESLRTRLGCRVVRAESAEDALEMLATAAFDLVISDVRLPGKNGLDLLRELRRRWPRLAERFFFITGDAGSRELNILLQETGCPVLRKPFSMEALVKQTSAFLQAEMQKSTGAPSSKAAETPRLFRHPSVPFVENDTTLTASH